MYILLTIIHIVVWSVPDHRGATAKRQGRGPGRRLRRYGIPDGLRPARIGNAAFQGHHDIRYSFYVYLAGAFNCRHAQRRGRYDDPRKGSAGEEVRAWGQSAGASAGAHDRDTVGRWDQGSGATNAAPSAPSEEVDRHEMRRWRNWQTH